MLNSAMQFKKKIFGIIVVLMSAALLGLIALQLILLDNAIELKKQAFRQNVFAALNSIVQKLETHETVAKVVDFIITTPAGRDSAFVSLQTTNVDSIIKADSLHYIKRFLWHGNRKDFDSVTAALPMNMSPRMRVLALDSLGRHIPTPFTKRLPDPSHGKLLLDSLTSEEEFSYSYTGDSIKVALHAAGRRDGRFVSNNKNDNARRGMIIKIFDELIDDQPLPIEMRVPPAFLDSVIAATLKENSVDLPYSYGVLPEKVDSTFLSQANKLDTRLVNSEFKSRLFPNDVFYGHHNLALHFPDQQIYLLKQSAALLASSLILSVVIVGCYAYTVRTVFKQKKFSTALTDFINNMTHEFKTPISTISLASEALSNPTVRGDEDKLLRYNRIIQDENLRMRGQVEKILQMAMLEEGDYELNLDHLDAHAIIEKAIQNLFIQIENRNGMITSNLAAAEHIVEADALHLTGIIQNLLDNANKYGSDKPAISILTENKNGGILIHIKDNGVGITPEEQKRIFEKYYRVSTGNKHDVKGFGLGLSYVKLMVEAHGGAVEVQSEPGKGSTFTIFLPFHSQTKEAEKAPILQ